MNMEFIIANASQLLVVVAVICTLISVITEFTKEIGILNRIPTSLQVLILSIIICVTAFCIYFICENHLRVVLPRGCNFCFIHCCYCLLQRLGISDYYLEKVL